MRQIILAIMMAICSATYAQTTTEHVVQRGETLQSIATKYGVSVDELKQANKDAQNYLYTGMKLVIPQKNAASQVEAETVNPKSLKVTQSTPVTVPETLASSGQDVIVKKDGSAILSKVIEIGDSEIKYKKISNLNGPTYTIKKADILSINYGNGEKEVFEENVVKNSSVQQSYTQQQSATPVVNMVGNEDILKGINAGNRLQQERLLASAKNWKTVGNVIYWVGFIGGIGGGVLMMLSGADKKTYYIVAGSGVGSGLLGMAVCHIIGNNKENAANSVYVSHILKRDFKIGKKNHLTAGVDFLNDKKFKDKTLGLGVSYSF